MALEKKEIVEYIINGDKNAEAVTKDDKYAFVDFSSFCSNNCLYCQRSRDNWDLKRWRLSNEEIIEAFRKDYNDGKRKLFLYGGVDIFFQQSKFEAVIKGIKSEYPDAELWVALGEKVYEEYQAYKAAGADGFALFHRSANEYHFAKLHTIELYPDFRKKVHPFLREMGYKLCTGITVGWPYQTAEILAEDIAYIEELKPELVVVDIYEPQEGSYLKGYPKGDKKQRDNVIKLINKILPEAEVLRGLE